MPETHELAISLARIEGKIDANFSHLGSKVDEHEKAILNLAAGQTQHGMELAALKAVHADHLRTPGWIPVVAVLAALASILTTVIIAIVG